MLNATKRLRSHITGLIQKMFRKRRLNAFKNEVKECNTAPRSFPKHSSNHLSDIQVPSLHN